MCWNYISRKYGNSAPHFTRFLRAFKNELRVIRELASPLSCIRALVVSCLLAGATFVPANVAATSEYFPRQNLFPRLAADPKEPTFKLNFWWSQSDVIDDAISQFVFAESFGIYRFSPNEGRHQFQIDLSGGMYSQFVLDGFEFMNADFIGALPVTYRYNSYSLRLRLYHLSSHLGDDFIVKRNLVPSNVSFESLELLGSSECGDFRFYGGGEVVVRRSPNTLGRGALHLGAEYRTSSPLFEFGQGQSGHFVSALDIKFWSHHNFVPSVNFHAGLDLQEKGAGSFPSRFLRHVIEVYYGITPYGQFFAQDIAVFYVGLGVHIGL